KHQRGNALYELRQYVAAINVFNEAIGLLPDTDAGRLRKAQLLFERAFPEYDLEAYLPSYRTVQRAEAILTDLTNPDYDYLLSIYADLATTSRSLGFYREGAQYLAKAKKIYRKHADQLELQSTTQAAKEVLFLYNEVLLYADWGKRRRLLATMQELDDLRQIKNFNDQEQRMYAVALNWTGDHFLNSTADRKDDEVIRRGVAYIEKAVQVLDREKFPEHYLQFRFNLNKADRLKGNFAEALKGNEEILSLMQPDDVRVPFFWAQRELIFFQSKQKKKGLDLMRRMAERIHRGGDMLRSDYSNFQPSTILNHTGLLCELPDEFLKVFPNDSEVQQLATHFYTMALRQFIHCYPEANFNRKLRDYYDKTLGGILRMREIGYVDKKLNTTGLIEAMENIENRLNWKEFVYNRQYAKDRLPDSLRLREIDLRTQLVMAKAKDASAAERFDLEQQIEKLNRQIKARYPVHALFETSNWQLADCQRGLTAAEMVLRYKRLNERYYLFLIDQHHSSYVDLGPAVVIDALADSLLQNIRQRQPLSRIAEQLAALLIPDRAGAFEKWTIVADGNLHRLPFEVLQQEGEYLLTQKTISYASDLIFIHNPALQFNSKTDHKLLAFTPSYRAPVSAGAVSLRGAPPSLAGAQRESAWISALRHGQNFSGDAASVDNFQKHAPSAGMLHLAMHAHIDHQNPSLSYLSFSKGEQLFVEQLYGFDLRADLAVLSACNTGRGDYDDRRGLTSLQRAFVYAGVPSTVSGLWEIPDQATQQIMIEFYSRLHDGHSKAAALRAAKLQYLARQSDGALQHPFFWAGMVLHGQDGAIDSLRASGFGGWWIAGFLLLSVGLGWMLLRSERSGRHKPF
ncbi:MAG: CHAT domain-containing protein, partial [Bacteroidota bacterium]